LVTSSNSDRGDNVRAPCHFNESSSLESVSVLLVSEEPSDQRDALRGAVKSCDHIGPLNAGQCRAQQSQSGTFFLGPVREQCVRRSLSPPKQVQLFGLETQRCAQMPPASAPSLLQEALHLFLSVGG